MRAAIITGKELLDFQEFTFPETAPRGCVVIEIGQCGVCGSDVAAYRNGNPYKPVLSGHEWGGTVVAVGEDVTNLVVGDRVVNGVGPSCGVCAMCLAGNTGRCEKILGLGMPPNTLTSQHGGYAQRVIATANTMIKIPPTLDDAAAAMVEPATVALHAIRLLRPQIGDVAVVLGAGPIGLFAAQLLKLNGAARVIVVEPVQRRRNIAKQLGADEAVGPGPEATSAVMDLTGGLGADLVFDCAGLQATMTAAPALCRPGANIMLVGAPHEPFPISLGSWLGKELTVGTSLAHLHHEFGITIDLMTQGRLKTAPLHEKTVDLDGLDSAIRELAQGGDSIKVLVDPSAG